ncbi:MAG: hypothetical protein ABJE95_03840 [Byssovorax sp.]
MDPTEPSEDQLLAVHAALLEGCQADLARGGDPLAPDRVALIALPHGMIEAQIAFGSRAEVARELAYLAVDEGPAASGLPSIGAALRLREPAAEGRLLCVVVALGRARIHDIPWPRAAPPSFDA